MAIPAGSGFVKILVTARILVQKIFVIGLLVIGTIKLRTPKSRVPTSPRQIVMVIGTSTPRYRLTKRAILCL